MALPSWNLYVVERGTVSPQRGSGGGGKREEGEGGGEGGGEGASVWMQSAIKGTRHGDRKGWDEVFPESIYSESTFH